MGKILLLQQFALGVSTKWHIAYSRMADPSLGHVTKSAEIVGSVLVLI
jgi:hypothetical protein